MLAAAGWLAGWLVVLLRLADAAGCCWLGLAAAGCCRLVLVATLLLLAADAGRGWRLLSLQAGAGCSFAAAGYCYCLLLLAAAGYCCLWMAACWLLAAGCLVLHGFR